MIQFNLLPDVKLEYVKTQRTKHLLTLISFCVSAAGIAILLLAFVSVDIVQKKSLHDLSGDITKYSQQLKDVKDIDKILTVQNQLSTLTSLHDKKPVASRLFTYLSQLTPAQASINQLSMDFGANTLSIGGTTLTLDTVSTYTDTLKATTFTVSGDSKKTAAFSKVVLSAFGRTDTGTSFTITCNFMPDIFDTTKDITLQVPKTAGADQTGVFRGDK